MSPLQIATLATGILFTVIRVTCIILEACANQTLITPSAGSVISLGACTSWLGFFSAYCRDHINRRLALMEVRIASVIDGYGQQCLEDGRLDAARAAARRAATAEELPNQTRNRIRPVD